MDATVQVAIVGILSALLGGGVWTFAAKWLDIGVTTRSGELKRQDEKINSLETELSKCEERHSVLEGRLRAVEAKSTSYFAMWIKDRHGRLIWLNDKAFLTLFAPLGYSRDELDGKTFRDLLDPVAADELDFLAKAALAHPGATQSILIQLHPDLPFLVVIKVCSVAESGEVQYEGCAYQPNDPEIETAMGVRRQVIQRSWASQHLIHEKPEDDDQS